MPNETRKSKFKRQKIIKFKNGRNSPLIRESTVSRLGSPSVDSPQKDTPEYLDALIRRLFTLSIKKNDILLSRLSSSEAVDRQLYALIGLLFRSFINGWYNNITDDQTLIADILKLISHITKELEIRLDKIDVLTLVLDDIPYLFDNHLKNYRTVNLELGSSILPYDIEEEAFYRLSEHPVLSQNTKDMKTYLRILTKLILKQLLPESDRSSQLAFKFLNSLVSDMLLNNIIEKVSQPYQIFGIIQLVCGILLKNKVESESGDLKEPSSNNKSGGLFDNLVKLTSNDNRKTTQGVLDFHIFSFLNHIFSIGTKRPYLYAAVKTICNFQPQLFNNALSNILSETVLKFIKSENFFVLIIKALRNNLYPRDEDMGPRFEPTEEQIKEIKQTTKNAMKDVCNKHGILSGLIIASNDEELDDALDDFLTGFENSEINKHLIFRLLDLLIVRILPELTTTTSDN